jgi:hypothetical protein
MGNLGLERSWQLDAQSAAAQAVHVTMATLFFSDILDVLDGRAAPYT